MTTDFWTEKEKEILSEYGDAMMYNLFKELRQQHEKEIQELREIIPEQYGMVAIADVEKAINKWINTYFAKAMNDEHCQIIWCFQLQELKQSIRNLSQQTSQRKEGSETYKLGREERALPTPADNDCDCQMQVGGPGKPCPKCRGETQ